MGNRVKEFNTLPIESKQCIVIERYGDVFSRASHFEIPWRIVLISPMSYLGMKFVVFILKLSENVSLGKKSWVLLIKYYMYCFLSLWACICTLFVLGEWKIEPLLWRTNLMIERKYNLMHHTLQLLLINIFTFVHIYATFWGVLSICLTNITFHSF